MEVDLKIGIEGRIEIVVSAKDTASVYGSGLLEVYATPAMIALMENAAHSSILQYVPQTYTSVGIEINAKHLKATPIGGKLYCTSKLVMKEGNKLTFEIQVRDEKDLVGEAVHVRYLVEIERFMKKIS